MKIKKVSYTKILVLFCIIAVSALMIGCDGELPIILVFSADPECIELGDSSTLTWDVSNADTFTIAPGAYMTGTPAGSSGDVIVSPVVTTVFTLVATNSNGSTVAECTVHVGSCSVRNLTQDLYYGTIQDALDDANSGDTIEANDGIYDESIIFPSGLAIILQSVNGSSLTTIRGVDHSPTVRVDNAIFGTTIEGFTITHAAGDFGSGIHNFSGTAAIIACSITGNLAEVGGGIYSNGGSLVITESDIGKNTAISSGGGIYNSSKMEIFESAIFGNSAGNNGGGICNFNGLTIAESAIYGNSSTHSGGGIYNQDANMSITGASTIYFNNADAQGGGIYNRGGLAIRGASTIYSNNAYAEGVGIFNYSGTLTIVASSIYDNSVEVFDCGGIFIDSGSLIPTIGGSNSAEKNTICGNYKTGGVPALDQQIRGSSGDFYSTYAAYNYIYAICP